MPLKRVAEPFDHPDWVFELKYDGFRALAYVAEDACRLVSRNGHAFKTFPGLCLGLAAEVRGHRAILDGEVVCLDREGRPLFKKDGPYGTEPTSWIKIKNSAYSQAKGRHEQFASMRAGV